jgi:hypothetical protein
MGFLLMLFGALSIADGMVMEPVRRLRIGAGILFVIAGFLYLFRTRPASRPAP